MTFEDLGLKGEILKALSALGFENPTPIQEQAIPMLLNDSSDLVGLAQTGTGKTAAFGLPLVHNVEGFNKKPEGLVICPTRELCLQISKDLKSYAKHLDLNIVPVYGGTDIRKQIKDIRRGAQIVVATPGRLVDLIKRKEIHLDEVECVVLDEADEMLNMGFKEDIDTILERTPEWKKVWLFSATMPKEVARIAKTYMENPAEISVGKKNQTNENISHISFICKDRDRYRALKRLIDFNPSIYGVIFCRTRRETADVAEKLGRDGYNSEPLHGDLSQAQRDRVMQSFRKKSLDLLVATDVAARGIDVDGITHVIHYNLPDDVENYTHRSGRTARAGKKGESLAIIGTKEQYKIKQIEKVIQTQFVKGTIPGPKEICEIQLMKLVNKVVATEVKENDIEEFLPLVFEQFEGLTKEEVIKRFVSAEFNKFLDYYERAGDLNAKEGSSGGRDRDGRRDRGRDRGRRKESENTTRFFASLGRKDDLNPGGLLRVICDETGLTSNQVGKIDIMNAYSFFEVENQYADQVLSQVNGAQYEGKQMNVEVTKKKASSGGGGRRNGGGGRNRSGGGGRSGGGRRNGGGRRR